MRRFFLIHQQLRPEHHKTCVCLNVGAIIVIVYLKCYIEVVRVRISDENELFFTVYTGSLQLQCCMPSILN